MPGVTTPGPRRPQFAPPAGRTIAATNFSRSDPPRRRPGQRLPLGRSCWCRSKRAPSSPEPLSIASSGRRTNRLTAAQSVASKRTRAAISSAIWATRQTPIQSDLGDRCTRLDCRISPKTQLAAMHPPNARLPGETSPIINSRDIADASTRISGRSLLPCIVLIRPPLITISREVSSSATDSTRSAINQNTSTHPPKKKRGASTRADAPRLMTSEKSYDKCGCTFTRSFKSARATQSSPIESSRSMRHLQRSQGLSPPDDRVLRQHDQTPCTHRPWTAERSVRCRT